MRVAKFFILVLTVFCAYVLITMRMNQPELTLPDFVAAPAVPASSVATPAPLAVPSATPEPTPEPTPTPTPMPTPQLFTISVIGDQTLASAPQFRDSSVGYIARMHGDYSYPFSNTAEYFLNDDFTISNLECTFTDKQLYSAQQFSFRAPTDYAQILTAGGVDFVTTANNHMLDFGQEGLDDTWATLEYYGIPYGKEDDSNLYTTESGLTIGIYTAYNSYKPSADKAAAAIRSLREQGAEYVICAFHWGQELYYQPNAFQIELGHACIDAGADLIFGCHTHCLQPIEQYNGGIILYSMGNWSFGGSTSPTDKDTAIVQITLMRDLDGVLSVAALKAVPCCVSSRPVKEGYTGDNYNDYVPTPYTEGSKAYLRALSKLEGTFKPDKEGRDYSDVYASYG